MDFDAAARHVRSALRADNARSPRTHGAVVRRVYSVVAMIMIAGCVSAPATATRSTAAPLTAEDPTDARPRIVTIALQYVGSPYARRGASPAGFDCSGFVMYVYGRAGIALPHSALKQYRLGTAVSRDALEPADVVFFDHLRHSGIYIGDGRFVHASKTGDFVKVSRLDQRWFRSRWVGARRLL